jgi:hypothetical protein
MTQTISRVFPGGGDGLEFLQLEDQAGTRLRRWVANWVCWMILAFHARLIRSRTHAF